MTCVGQTSMRPARFAAVISSLAYGLLLKDVLQAHQRPDRKGAAGRGIDDLDTARSKLHRNRFEIPAMQVPTTVLVRPIVRCVVVALAGGTELAVESEDYD